jgi:hypothetical protein
LVDTVLPCGARSWAQSESTITAKQAKLMIDRILTHINIANGLCSTRFDAIQNEYRPRKPDPNEAGGSGDTPLRGLFLDAPGLNAAAGYFCTYT